MIYKIVCKEEGKIYIFIIYLLLLVSRKMNVFAQCHLNSFWGFVSFQLENLENAALPEVQREEG